MALDMNNFSTDMTEKEAVYSDKKLRIGIIGTGGIAHSHIRAYQHQPDVEIVAACDLIPGKAEKFLKEYNVEAPTFEDYKKMIDTVPMDAVSVCAYNRNHAVCTIYALEHGLNVLLEKPMSVTAGRGRGNHAKLKRRAARSLSIGFQPRLDANMKMIKKIVESGDAGPACTTSRPAAVAVTASRSAGPRPSSKTTTAGIGAAGRHWLLCAGHGAERHRLSQAPDRYRPRQPTSAARPPKLTPLWASPSAPARFSRG